MITIPKAEPPALLYKYYPPERVDVVEGLEVRFSPPSDFNDAFDSYHLLPKTSDPKARMKRVRLRNELGVFCLAERADDQVMWVTYAKNHTGFVLGFDAAARFFEEDDRALRKVIYQDRPPVFIEADENGCFYKAPAWGYEREWRCVRRFGKDERRLVSFDWSVVKSIVFGHQMDRWMVSRLVQFATMISTPGDPPAFYSSTPAHSQWKFVNQEARLTMCPHCEGDGYTRKK